MSLMQMYMSTIPTGSPGTEHSSVDVLILTIIGRVATSAYISWGEYNSYGRNSPDTGNRLNPCVIMNRGVVAGYNFSIFVYDSYGWLLRARI